MTKEEIIELAKQAHFLDYELDDGTTDAFDQRYEAFAKLIAEHEREACAKVCDSFQARDVGMQPAECAGAIRARGQE